MGSSESKQYKADEDLPSTPMQCAAATKSSNVKNISEMDPRSPNFSIIRTPIEVAIIPNEAEVDTNMSQMEIAVDPRSPSDQFTRTPILIQNSVSGKTPLKLHNKILDNARRSIYYTPTMTSKIQKDFQINRSPIPPKLLESSPISRKHTENRKSFVGLLETNIDYTETDLDNYIQTNPFSSGLTINTNENFLSSGSIIKQENCDPRSPSTEFLRTPIQIIKKIGEVDLNKVDDDLEVDNQQYEVSCSNESLLKIATPSVELIEVNKEEIITSKSTKEDILENNSKVQNTSHDFETFNQENCIDMKNVEENYISNLQNKNDVISEDIVNILNDLVGHVETQLKQKEVSEKISIYSEIDENQPLMDLTVDIREFDRKLTKIIHEDNDTFSFKRTPKSDKEEKPRNRTPMKDRNIIEEPKRNKLKVSDKPRKLDSVNTNSKIPIFREKNCENEYQCENTITLDLGVRKKKKLQQSKWDSDKTLEDTQKISRLCHKLLKNTQDQRFRNICVYYCDKDATPMRIFTHSTDKAMGGSIATEVPSLAHSNITILGPRDSVSRRSWTQEVTSFDFGDFWKYRAEFFFNTLLYCLNMGNLWRLPTQAIQYGEGAFVYIYIVFTLIFGMPLLFFEFSVGQYTDKGVMWVFRIIPLLEGLSSAMGFFSNTVVHIYGLISVFNFIYFFSFIRIDAPLSDTRVFEKMCFYQNRTNSLENLHFLNDVVMAEDETSCTFNSRNMFLIFVMWLIIWVYTINEYATRPNHSVKIYAIIICALMITFIATMTVEGSGSGILRLLSPPWKNFADYKVYLHAFAQSVISLGLGMGPLINIGSRTFFRTPIHIHSIIVVVGTLLASLVMTMIVFGAVGVYSEELGYSEAVLSGQEYYLHVLLSKLFVKMAQGLKQLIIIVFYGAFLTAGFYSSAQYTKLMVEWMRSKWDIHPEYYSLIILIFCVCQSLISCGMISSHGLHLLYWSATDIFTSFSVMTLVLLEIVAFIYLYGMQTFCEDIEFMVGYRPNLWFKMVWYLSAVTCLLVIIGSYYEIGTSFFGWYEGFSYCIYLIVVLLPISIPAIRTIIRLTKEGNLSKLFHPRQIQTAFQDFANWRENLSNYS